MPPIRQLCPILFVVFSLVGALFLVWAIPPFMAADEVSHLARADLTIHGHLLGERIQVKGQLTSGGEVDQGLLLAARPFEPLMFHPEVKATGERYVQALRWRWSPDAAALPFPGAAAYPPILYAPVSLGLAAGKLAGLPVLRTIYLARLVNALASTLIGLAALQLAGRARLPLYALLLLPMVTALFAGAVQDGPMIATAALGAALISRALEAGRPISRAELAGAAVCIALLGMSKLPYGLLGLGLLACETERRRDRWFAAGLAVGLPLAWEALTAALVQAPLARTGVVLDPPAQLAFLVGHPAEIVPIALDTLKIGGPYELQQFVGVLGWLDTPLPRPYYWLAYLVLALSFAAAAGRGTAPGWRRLRPTLALLGLLAAGGVYGALYLIWTPVGFNMVEGVQGRYFLPLAMFLPLLVAGERPWLDPQGGARRLGQAAGAAVLLFPLVSLLVTQRAVVVRYFLS